MAHLNNHSSTNEFLRVAYISFPSNRPKKEKKKRRKETKPKTKKETQSHKKHILLYFSSSTSPSPLIQIPVHVLSKTKTMNKLHKTE